MSLFLLLGSLGFCLKAQPPNPTIPMPQTAVKAAYLGSVIYPGFKIGIERPYKIVQVEKAKKRRTKVFSKERSLTANLGYYHHTSFHDNFYLLVERQNRRQKASGWFMELAPGIGYSRTFLGGTTYTVSDDGVVDKKNLAGYNYALVSVAFGGGYNLAVKKEKPLKIIGKISLLGMFPYNSFVYFRPTVEVGVAYSPAQFWNANPIIKNKKK